MESALPGAPGIMDENQVMARPFSPTVVSSRPTIAAAVMRVKHFVVRDACGRCVRAACGTRAGGAGGVLNGHGGKHTFVIACGYSPSPTSLRRARHPVNNLLGQISNSLLLREKISFEGVARCSVDVVAVLHDASGGIVCRALRREQGGTAMLGQELGFLGGCGTRPDDLPG